MSETGGSVTGTVMLAVWNTVSSRFRKTAGQLKSEELSLSIGSASIGYMVRHNAEVEYMFAEWFFGKKIPAGMEMLTNRAPVEGKSEYGDREELVQLLEASNEHIVLAMQSLSEEAWHTPVNSPIGPSTPVEAIGRLIYHTGLHAGQVSLIQKHAPREI